VTNEEDPSGTTSEHFRAGIEDVVMLPMVAIALVVKKVLRSAWTILRHILDFLFPILLQLLRFPLFTLRILGDGGAALLKGIARILPIGGVRRAAWREFVSQHGRGCARRSVTRPSKKRCITSSKTQWAGCSGNVGNLRRAPRCS
jgi:hypothetical protein